MADYSEEPFEYPTKPKSTKNEYFGSGWSVRHESDRFIFSFISGDLQGQEKQIEITKEDYLKARAGQIGFDALCIKYGAS